MAKKKVKGAGQRILLLREEVVKAVRQLKFPQAAVVVEWVGVSNER